MMDEQVRAGNSIMRPSYLQQQSNNNDIYMVVYDMDGISQALDEGKTESNFPHCSTI